MARRGGRLRHHLVLMKRFQQGLAAPGTGIQSGVVRRTGGERRQHSKDQFRVRKGTGTGMGHQEGQHTAGKVLPRTVGDGRVVQQTRTGGGEELHRWVSMGLHRGLVTIRTRGQGSCTDLGSARGQHILVAEREVLADTVTTGRRTGTQDRCCDQGGRCTR